MFSNAKHVLRFLRAYLSDLHLMGSVAIGVLLGAAVGSILRGDYQLALFQILCATQMLVTLHALRTARRWRELYEQTDRHCTTLIDEVERMLAGLRARAGREDA